jgi:predicted DCC family thiol-disulfide oxidoreductase YuxK
MPQSTPPGSRPRGIRSPKGRPTLIYDGECDLCRRAVARLREWDRGNRIVVAAFQDRATMNRLAARFPAMPELPALAAAMHLILPDGRVFAGADAIPELLNLLPGKQWMRRIFDVPGARPLARRLYRRIAERRHCRVRSTNS